MREEKTRGGVFSCKIGVEESEIVCVSCSNDFDSAAISKRALSWNVAPGGIKIWVAIFGHPEAYNGAMNDEDRQWVVR